jgi:hypothetical protein
MDFPEGSTDAPEEVVKSDLLHGPENDLEHATRIAARTFPPALKDPLYRRRRHVQPWVCRKDVDGFGARRPTPVLTAFEVGLFG